MDQPTTPLQHRRLDHLHSRHGSYSCSSIIEQRWTSDRLLHDASKPDSIRGLTLNGFFQRRWLYEKDYCRCIVFDWLLRRKHHRYVSLCYFDLDKLIPNSKSMQALRSSAPKMPPAMSLLRSQSSSVGASVYFLLHSSGGGIGDRTPRKPRSGRVQITCGWRTKSKFLPCSGQWITC
jgi:hypothetical protein